MVNAARANILATVLIAARCTTTAELYPVKGPLTQETPVPVIVAAVNGITGNTGRINFTAGNGASCLGKWSSAAPQYSSLTTIDGYGGPFGTAVTSGIVPGINRGHAFATCSDDARFNIEFVTGSGTANGYGIAEDTQGNVYRVLF